MSQPKRKINTQPKTERDHMFMKDKFGLPLNPAIQGKSSKTYGVLKQH